MPVREITENKKQLLELLLLADEQESMIDKYLERGTLLVLEDGDIKAECVVTDEGAGVLEVKNLAVMPAYQRQGWGRRLLAYVEQRYRSCYSTLRVGTGDSPATLPFYYKCGFQESYRLPGFFLDNYAHPIIEQGVQLTDMVVLEKAMRK